MEWLYRYVCDIIKFMPKQMTTPPNLHRKAQPTPPPAVFTHSFRLLSFYDRTMIQMIHYSLFLQGWNSHTPI